MRALALALVLGAAGCAGIVQPDVRPLTATAELKTVDGRTVGTANLSQVPAGVRVVLDARGLPPGPKGVHIHAVGTCDPPDFNSAGPHFNPDNKKHGLQNPEGPHAGDLSNLTVGADGNGRLESLNDRIALDAGPKSVFDADGAALVIHAAADDFKTDPTGNSGARLACGVIRKTGT